MEVIIMNQKSKEEVFSQLVDSMNQWLTDCLFLCGSKIRGKYQLKGIRDEVWDMVIAYAEVSRNKYGREKEELTQKTAVEITSLLNAAIEDLIKENTSNNFFIIDLSVHRKEIVEKLSYIK